jgi:hypothetical protein
MIDGAYWAAEAHVPYEERIHAKFPIPPSAVGNAEQVIWARGTVTAASIRAKLSVMHVAAAEQTDEVVEDIIEALEAMLRQRARYPSWVLDNEFEQLCRDVVQRRSAPRSR